MSLTDAQAKKNYQDIVNKYHEWVKQFSGFESDNNIGSSLKEEARDWIEDHSMRKETDWEDQFVNWLGDILDDVLKVVTPIVLGAVTGGAGLVVGGAIGQTIGEEARKSLEKSIEKYRKEVGDSFYTQKYRVKLWIMRSVIKYLYKDVFLDGDYQKVLAEGAGKNTRKRVLNRVLFYKTVLTSFTYSWEGQYSGVPDLVFTWEMTPKQFADTFMLYFLRHPNLGENLESWEVYKRTYLLHEFFKNESKKTQNKEENDKKLNKALTAGGIIAAAITIITSMGG